MPLSELHSRIGGSSSYLAKVTASLARVGIVVSYRGAQGGLLLAKAPKEIPLVDVVSAIQGRITSAACLTTETAKVQVCTFHRAMDDLNKSIISSLGKYTLADLLEKPCCHTSSGKVCPDCKMRPKLD